MFGDPFVPEKLRADECGASPEANRLLRLVDLKHPSWPTIAFALQEMRACGIEMDEGAVQIAVKVGRQRWERAEKLAPPSTGQPAPGGSIVYYVRRGEVIKIGTTVHPQRRFTELMPDEILVVEPGGYREERQRHRQFAHLRGAGEYFRIAPELLDHVSRLLAAHGAPDPSWPTTAIRQPARAAAEITVVAEVDMSVTVTGPGMLLTRQEAAEVARVSVERIRTWERRGHIERAGVNEDGQPVYVAVDIAKAQYKLRGWTRVAA